MEIAIELKFLKSTTTKNPAKFKQNYDLQVVSNSQLPLCFIILISNMKVLNNNENLVHGQIFVSI